MKINLDLAGTNSDNGIADELKTDVGSSAFDLDHDRFFGTAALLRIWTGVGETGTQLTLNTDYTMQGLDSDLTAEAIAQVWSQIKIENVAYQTGDLYFNYHAVADEINALDHFGTVTVSAVGPTDDLDVSQVRTIFLDCSGGNVTIGGFVGGVNGQKIHIVRLDAAANDATLEHDEGTGNQDLFLHKGADETLTGEYGGWCFVCDGSNWYDTSHAIHV